MSARTLIVVGALFGGLAVVTGAFGAHGLKDRRVVQSDRASESARLAAAKRLDSYEIAVRYQMYHALALVLLGLLTLHHASLWSSVAGGCFIAGIAVFSGLLYALALGGPKWLGAVVPLGGLAFIIGWLALAGAALAMAKHWPAQHG